MDSRASVFDVEAAAERLRGKPGALLGLLEEIQDSDPARYLSEENLKRAAAALAVPPSQVWSVATFYGFFNLQPQGRRTITVCRGTACHTRGSLGLLKDAASLLGCEGYDPNSEGAFTTADREYTIRTVACFGQCALAPVVMIDDEIYSRMTPGRLVAVLSGAKKRGAKKAAHVPRRRYEGEAAPSVEGARR